MNYELIKEYFDNGYWGKARVANAVKRGIITPEQYKEITGEDYVG